MAQLLRLNKYLAESGVCSRRKADDYISGGRVKVNGKVVQELGTKIAVFNDTVMVDDNIVKPTGKEVVIMFYKPKGCLTTTNDELGRTTIFDYLKLDIPHLFPVGRLDYESEGLLLLTNNGELANKLMHPSHEVPKTYLVKIGGEMAEHRLAQLRKGVEIDGEITNRAKVKLMDFTDNESRLEVTISEGRNRQVRKMFETVGNEVTFLKRVAVGDLRLGGLARGAYRYLTDGEVAYLKNL